MESNAFALNPKWETALFTNQRKDCRPCVLGIWTGQNQSVHQRKSRIFALIEKLDKSHKTKLMNIDEFVFSQPEDLQRFEEWWRSSEWADREMPQGDWKDQFDLWADSEQGK